MHPALTPALPMAAVQPGAAGAADLHTQLTELCGRQAEGELTCATAGGEVRIYLQGGRLAWATDSVHRRAFTARLRALAGIDEVSLERVVAGCLKSRSPIGEGLLRSGLACEEHVREALRHQIALALSLALQARERRTAFVSHRYGKYDSRLTFDLTEVLPAAAEPAEQRSTPAPTPTPAPTAPAGGEPSLSPEAAMSATEKLKELQAIEGFAGAAVFTPAGEPLTLLEGDAPHLKEVGILANNVLLNAQKTSLEMGAGRGQQVHVEGEKAHVLVRCLNEGTDPLKSQPGKAHIHLVLVLKNDSSIGLAKMRIGSAAQKLAEDFRF